MHTDWYAQLTQNEWKKEFLYFPFNYVDIANIVDNNYDLYNLAYGFVVWCQGESIECE